MPGWDQYKNLRAATEELDAVLGVLDTSAQTWSKITQQVEKIIVLMQELDVEVRKDNGSPTFQGQPGKWLKLLTEGNNAILPWSKRQEERAQQVDDFRKWVDELKHYCDEKERVAKLGVDSAEWRGYRELLQRLVATPQSQTEFEELASRTDAVVVIVGKMEVFRREVRSYLVGEVAAWPEVEERGSRNQKRLEREPGTGGQPQAAQPASPSVAGRSAPDKPKSVFAKKPFDEAAAHRTNLATLKGMKVGDAAQWVSDEGIRWVLVGPAHPPSAVSEVTKAGESVTGLITRVQRTGNKELEFRADGVPTGAVVNFLHRFPAEQYPGVLIKIGN